MKLSLQDLNPVKVYYRDQGKPIYISTAQFRDAYYIPRNTEVELL